MQNNLTREEAKECLGIFLPMSLNWEELAHFYALYSISKKTELKLYPFLLNFMNSPLEIRTKELMTTDYKTLEPHEAESLYIQKTKDIIKSKSYIFKKLKNKELLDKLNQ
jgi:hypothetical protein